MTHCHLSTNMSRALARRAAGNAVCLLQSTDDMLLTLAILLALAWVFGFAVFHVAHFAIHLLIIGAVIAAIAHFVAPGGYGRRRVV
jgi:hypothetical protein